MPVPYYPRQRTSNIPLSVFPEQSGRPSRLPVRWRNPTACKYRQRAICSPCPLPTPTVSGTPTKRYWLWPPSLTNFRKPVSGPIPLYVFTNRGVWSLESGSGEVLYSNIIPVNHDRIINPATATAAGTVFYITSRGLYGLQGRRSRLLSEPLGNMVTDYLAGAEIHYQFKYGDLLVYNPAYSYAYVYAVQHGVWSTRDMAGTVLNNDEIVTGLAPLRPR